MYIFWNYQSKAIRDRKLKLILVGCDDKYNISPLFTYFLLFQLCCDCILSFSVSQLELKRQRGLTGEVGRYHI